MTNSAITRVWGRVPLLVRAILTGFAISTLGVAAWLACQKVIPSPWWFLVMGGLLWLYWRYFSGSWWPASTAEYRRASFRDTRLPAAVWGWGLVAAACFVVAIAVEGSSRVPTIASARHPLPQSVQLSDISCQADYNRSAECHCGPDSNCVEVWSGEMDSR